MDVGNGRKSRAFQYDDGQLGRPWVPVEPAQWLSCLSGRSAIRSSLREENSGLTLSFFGEEYRDALKICGSRSGRDTDKVAEAGLTRSLLRAGMSLSVRRRWCWSAASFTPKCSGPEAFALPGILEQWYPTGDLHKMYVVEIVNVWRR